MASCVAPDVLLRDNVNQDSNIYSAIYHTADNYVADRSAGSDAAGKNAFMISFGVNIGVISFAERYANLDTGNENKMGKQGNTSGENQSINHGCHNQTSLTTLPVTMSGDESDINPGVEDPISQGEFHLDKEEMSKITSLNEPDYRKCKSRNSKKRLRNKADLKRSRQMQNKKWKLAPTDYTDFRKSVSLSQNIPVNDGSADQKQENDLNADLSETTSTEVVENSTEAGDRLTLMNTKCEGHHGNCSFEQNLDIELHCLAVQYEISADNEEYALDHFYGLDKYAVDTVNRLEGKYKGYREIARRVKKWKTEKAFKQVKTKYCKSVRNNIHGKSLYVHHRVFKLMEIEVRRPVPIKEMKISRLNIDITIKKSVQERKIKHQAKTPKKHVLNEYSNTADLDTDLISLLINIQNRDITPEDFDLLLRLDDKVAPKTVNRSVLNSLKTDSVNSEHVTDVCPICMDNYEIGQKRKHLPCGHIFHSQCIDNWLSGSSINCPLDGLAV